MPILPPPLRAALAALLLAPLARGAAPSGDAGVAVLHAAACVPGDAVRSGAGEFQVMISVASLQREHRSVGVVGVGGRYGVFLGGGERALRFFALQGVPVAKVSPQGRCAADPEGLFLDAGSLPESKAAAIMADCLRRFGAPPAAADPDRPTPAELAAIRSHLDPFRQAFALAGSGRAVALW